MTDLHPNDVFRTDDRLCPVTQAVCLDCDGGECKRIKKKPRREYTRIEAVAPVFADEPPVDLPAYERTPIDPTKRAPVEHELKIWPTPFHAICAGQKKHEVRRFDRDYRVGDFLRLREYDPARAEFTGTEARVRISYITAPGTFGLPADLGVISIEKAYERAKKPAAPKPAEWPFPNILNLKGK